VGENKRDEKEKNECGGEEENNKEKNVKGENLKE